MQHRLRGEAGYKSNDLAHWLIHIPSFHPSPANTSSSQDSAAQHRYDDDDSMNVPLEVAMHLTEYVRAAKVNDLIDVQTQTVMNVASEFFFSSLYSFYSCLYGCS